MKIIMSKSQWNYLNKMSQAQTQFIELEDINDNAIPKSTQDKEILDKTLGKHDFYVYSLPDVEKELKQNTIYSILVNGMNITNYLRQKVLKKYNLL